MQYMSITFSYWPVVTSLSSTIYKILSLYVTARDLEKSFTFDNKSSPKSFGKSHVTTLHSRKWTRPAIVQRFTTK